VVGVACVIVYIVDHYCSKFANVVVCVPDIIYIKDHYFVR